MLIGERFHEILHSEVLTSITKASNSIASDLAHSGGEGAREININAHKELLEDMRHVINCYIDCQLDTFKKVEDTLLGFPNNQSKPDTKLYQGIEAMENLTIGERIKALRKQNKMTQLEFGKMFGVHQAYISSIETGNDKPSKILSLLICAKLGIDEAWLIGGRK